MIILMMEGSDGPASCHDLASCLYEMSRFVYQELNVEFPELTYNYDF